MRAAEGRRMVAIALCAAALPACMTGETAVDARTEAVRQIVRDAGVTEDVATCIVDELDATIGLDVLDDEATSDEQALQLNQITTDCLLAAPEGGSSTTTPPPASSTGAPAVPTTASGATTTIGAPAP